MVNFYKVLKRNFEELKAEVECTLHSEFQHNQAREIYSNPLSHSAVLRAWAVWTLSHQSIYSILTNQWSVSIDKNKAKQIQNSKEAFTITYARRLERTSIYCRDALNVIKSTDTPTTFHYVDPPYYNADMGHYPGYTIEDFERLLQVLSEIEGKFLLSSYPSELLDRYIRENGWHTINIDMTKSSGAGIGTTSHTKTEVLTLNYDNENTAQQGRLF
jgi:DNA adenine methylase